MKKILSIILILLIAVNLFGCRSEKASNENPYDFEYKFKEGYSDKIRVGLAGAFIDFTRDTVEFYDVAFEDFDESIEEELGDLMVRVVQEYTEHISDMNEEEKELFGMMLSQAKNVGLLGMLKAEYAIDQTSESMGIKPKQTEEYYEKEFNQLKANVEESIEKARKYID